MQCFQTKVSRKGTAAKEDTIRPFVRVMNRIRVPRVRCVDENGNMLGVMSTRDAIAVAERSNLDLVEVQPNADPPVCRIMNYGKFKYDQQRKEKMARKGQHAAVLKEIKFHSNVEQHDYDTKVKHIKDFFKKGHKVKVMLSFRGRENAHRELGFEVMERVKQDCQDEAVIDSPPKMVGRSIIMIMGPRSSKS